MKEEEKRTAAYRAAMRVRGFNDGIGGREKASNDPEYQQSYRRGRERREAVQG